MLFFSRVIFTVAAALALAGTAQARCGNSGDPDDCPDNSCGSEVFGCFACDSGNC
ncbi:hypothetical protein DFH09DRAFT_1311654 [Mycena vulgaris]|nr:hypothetical protein DFH09DRAFT_1311654 [Mycena vulgaris]